MTPRQSLKIWELKHLAQQLGTEPRELLRAVDLLPEYVRHFTLSPDVKPRPIYWVPEGTFIHDIQGRTKALLEHITLPKQILGGRKGRQPRDFARPHIGKTLLVEIDIQNFYPSVSSDRVEELFIQKLDCSSEVGGILRGLTTFASHLPHGFQTSTHIANILLRQPIWRVSKLCQEVGADLTVWGDNIVLSGSSRIEGIAERVVGIIETEARVRCHPPKLLWAAERAQTICSMTVNNCLAWNRSDKVPTEEAIRQLLMGQVPDGYSSFEKAVESLQGKAAGVTTLAPRVGRKLRYLVKIARRKRRRSHAANH
jgi:hypothetical protein